MASPDGKFGVLRRAVSFDPDMHKIVGRPQSVTGLSKGSMGLDLSRDGDRIMLVSAGQHEDLYVARSDGSALRQISYGTFKARLPQLSPADRPSPSSSKESRRTAARNRQPFPPARRRSRADRQPPSGRSTHSVPSP